MAELSGTVKLPGVGPVPKKELAIGVAVVAIVAVVYYVRNRQSGSATTAAAGAASSSDQYPPDGTTGNPQDPYSTDPATGQTYGDEAVGSGGTFGAYGTGGAYDTSGDTYPWDGSYGNSSDPYSEDPATGLTYGDEGLAGNTGTSGTSGGPPFTSNSAWENWVIQQLQANDPGINTGELQTALGLYLDGQPVSPAQKTLILDATATANNPPVAGPNNYPPNVRLNGSKGGGTASKTVTVPDVKGKDMDSAESAIRAAGLDPTVASWATSSAGAKIATGTSPAAGKSVARGSRVRINLQRQNAAPPARK